jgi:hypothetical protein
MKKPYQGHITNWSLVLYAGEIVIVGVTKAPTRNEEHFIRTSAIQMLSPNSVETKNSIYTLGPMARP